ncbi:hypothetical protein H4Q26_005508 [Puccinia striiformis f. sp. tritici PST-130]|nr:hypothetical protein H4Q26_005508 [Puccinia striiformis f. sp. tritici PST-130]
MFARRNVPRRQTEEWCKLAAMGFRTGCEYVDIELGLTPEQNKALCRKARDLRTGATVIDHDQHGTIRTDVSNLVSGFESDDSSLLPVTIPLKVEIIKHLDQLTPDAQALLGANTDWQAIKAKIEANLPAQQALGLITPGQLVRASGVVIGAGGTARAAVYALHSLGYEQIYIHNRTRSKAEEVAKNFPSYFGIRVIDSLGYLCSGQEGVWLPSAIISARPSSDKLEIPLGLFDRSGGGVVIEMSYSLGKSSPVLRAVENNVGWKSVDGFEVLIEQGARQFQLWTGKLLSLKAVSQASRGVLHWPQSVDSDADGDALKRVIVTTMKAANWHCETLSQLGLLIQLGDPHEHSPQRVPMVSGNVHEKIKTWYVSGNSKGLPDPDWELNFV